jgi:glutaredoxin-like protein NrdH
MTHITVYCWPGCSACEATNRYLNRHGIDHLEVDLSTDPAAKAFVEKLGYSSAPVVVAGSAHWSGMRPDRLLALKP